MNKIGAKYGRHLKPLDSKGRDATGLRRNGRNRQGTIPYAVSPNHRTMREVVKTESLRIDGAVAHAR